MASIDGTLPETGLHKGTNWWGAFVIGLAGTILVTGIAPYVVQGTGPRAPSLSSTIDCSRRSAP